MNGPQNRVDDIFWIASEIDSAAARDAYLLSACGDDSELRKRVEELLQARPMAQSYLEQPAAVIATADMPPLTEKPGTVVGPYKLLQQIGEGGFGVVYMAEQTEPVRRKVALKIIKPGMDTKEVIARFEAERQALALMDHPNIARVLDAGATESGRPYFVMELVKGVPLTEYCDKNHLSGQERLRLFVAVCHAIQHAHQKGVIHRDLKPSNIMVTLHDGKPVPKVIDFGVSKALSQQLTEKTLFTAYGQMVGTPAYMSPEQAEMSGLDIDTRSDVYSLGVLLYELLTGSTPFDAKRLRTAGYAEMQRIIREEEPVRPSTRLTTLGEESTVVSKNRGTDPKKLGQLVRGDLDWIVMKALDKERNRRYETANGIAADIERFLADEAVEACPPSAVYRFRKFARRNKGPMTVTTAAVLALIAVAIGSTIAAGRFRNLAGEKEQALIAETDAKQEAEAARDAEQRQREEAERQTGIARQQTRRAEDALADAEAQRERAEANFALARSAVDEFLNHVTENELLTVPGLQPLRQELLSSAMEFYEDFTRDEANADELLAELARAHYRLAVIRGELGQKEESTAANEKSVELFEQLRDGGNNSLEVRLGLAKSYFRAGRYDDTVNLCRAILDGHPNHPETRSLLANTYNVLAIADKNDGDIASALVYHQQALPLRQGLVDEFPDDPVYLTELGSTVNNLGVLLDRQGKRVEALKRFQTAVTYAAAAYYQAPQTIRWGRWLCISLRNVAFKQATFGEQESALESFRQIVTIRQQLAFDNPAVPSLKGELYKAYIDLGNYQRDLALFDDANGSFRAAEEVLVHIPRETPEQLFELAIVYGALATPAEGAADLPDEEEQAEQQHYADLAVQTLQQAVQDGYLDVRMLKSHEYFAVLHEREDFQQLVDGLDQVRRAQQLASREGDTVGETLAARREAVNVLRNLNSNDETLADLLHSIGVLATGEKQFDEAEESLREALELRQELHQQDPQDPELQLGLLSTRIWLGELEWARGNLTPAHTRWQQCLAESAELLAAFPDSSIVQEGRLAAEERAIYRRYGRLALWPLLLRFANRTVRYERAHLFHIGDQRFTQGVLAANDPAATESLVRCLGTDLQDVDLSTDTARFNYSALIRTAAIADVQILPPNEMVSIAQRIFDEHRTDAGCAMALAVAQYRAGEYEQALETVRPAHRKYLAFLEAAITECLGDHVGALKLWADAQTRYQSLCGDLLVESSPPQDGTMRLTGWHEQWWHFATIQALRREAYRVVHGGEADDPWQHLIQARGYRLIGETEQSESELAAAGALDGDDPEISLARVRLFEQWGDIERAEAAWQRAVELAGDDPMPWIQRGRWYAQRGEQEQAEADFAHAASLTPNELNKFLEAGWWVIGPYPENLAEFCPPELDPDPSRPVRTIDPQSGVSDEPSPWVNVPTGKYGAIDLSGVPGGKQGSSMYALAQVYSPDDRSVLLMIDRNKKCRAWVNGELIDDYAPREGTVQPWYDMAHRLPISLKPGLNTILVKSADPELTVRLGDSPRDRVILLAEQRRFSEAAHLLTELQIPSADYQSGIFRRRLANLLALEPGCVHEYERICAELVEIPNPNLPEKNIFPNVCAQRPNPAFDENAQRLVSYAEEHLEATGEPWAFLNVALVNYRAGNFERAASLLAEMDWRARLPLQALLDQRLGHSESAATSLKEAFATGEEYATLLHAWNRPTPQPATTFPWYYQWAQFLNLLTEAEQTIRGTTTASDELRHTVEETMTEKWTASPQLAAYDHAILFTAYTPAFAAMFPELFVARGRRLAELGRPEEAEADFNKALELAPDDVEVLMARAEFYEQCGDVGRAWEEFSTALRTANNENRTTLIPAVERQLSLHNAVLDEGLRRNSDDERVLRLRAERQLMHRKWQDAIENMPGGYVINEACVASLCCLAGDGAGYRQSCERLDELIANDDTKSSWWRALVWSLKPPSEEVAAQLSELLATDLDGPLPRGQFFREAAGAAWYRMGRYEEALTILTESLQLKSTWQQTTMVWPLLAMTEWRLRHQEQARKWLERTAWWIDHSQRAVDVPHAFSAWGPNAINYWRWLMAHVFYREAQSLIDGDDGESPPDNELAATPDPESQASKSDEPNPGDP